MKKSRAGTMLRTHLTPQQCADVRQAAQKIERYLLAIWEKQNQLLYGSRTQTGYGPMTPPAAATEAG